MKPISKALALLREWMRANDLVLPNGRLDTRELARRYQKTARRLRGVRAPKYPPFGGMRAIVAGEAKPQYDTRECLRELTGGMALVAEWDEPAEVEP